MPPLSCPLWTPEPRQLQTTSNSTSAQSRSQVWRQKAEQADRCGHDLLDEIARAISAGLRRYARSKKVSWNHRVQMTTCRVGSVREATLTGEEINARCGASASALEAARGQSKQRIRRRIA